MDPADFLTPGEGMRRAVDGMLSGHARRKHFDSQRRRSREGWTSTADYRRTAERTLVLPSEVHVITDTKGTSIFVINRADNTIAIVNPQRLEDCTLFRHPNGGVDQYTRTLRQRPQVRRTQLDVTRFQQTGRSYLAGVAMGDRARRQLRALSARPSRSQPRKRRR